MVQLSTFFLLKWIEEFLSLIEIKELEIQFWKSNKMFIWCKKFSLDTLYKIKLWRIEHTVFENHPLLFSGFLRENSNNSKICDTTRKTLLSAGKIQMNIFCKFHTLYEAAGTYKIVNLTMTATVWRGLLKTMRGQNCYWLTAITKRFSCH